MKILSGLIVCLFFFSLASAQNMAEYQEKFVWDSVKQILAADFSKIEKPDMSDFKNQVFHFEPVRQDTTSTCWSYSAVSFLESEIFRLYKQKIKLSEMFIVYWEYVEKARRFIQQNGESYFAQGSESNAVTDRIKQYGIVPTEAYNGLLNGQTKHNHKQLFKEMDSCLKSMEENSSWDEQAGLEKIKAILDKFLGKTPESFEYQGKQYTPLTFRDEAAKINPDDYAVFMSTMSRPFYIKGEYEAPDNWWHSDEYHNVPLIVYYQIIKRSIENGFSVVVGGDVSEPGKYGWEDIAVVVPWDIPAALINQSSRELRVYNETTTDDHGIHMVGSFSTVGHDWFLIKDSGSSSHYGRHKGYYFFRDNFVKLKMLSFMVHKDAAGDVLENFRN